MSLNIFPFTIIYVHYIYTLCCVQGDYDDILPWPFKQKVTFTLIDQHKQTQHITESFRPDPASSSFQKPTVAMNVASGSPLFVAHKTLESDSKYFKNESLFFKVVVDIKDLHIPWLSVIHRDDIDTKYLNIPLVSVIHRDVKIVKWSDVFTLLC